MKKKKINTMAELSEAIGVSRPTLSRYFQDPNNVRGSTARKIRQGLETFEYVPNFFATRLNRKTTGLIGVVMPYVNDLFFTKLLESIEVAAMAAGFKVISQWSHSDPKIEAQAVETLMSMNVDGALIAPLGNQSEAMVQERLHARVPTVLIDSRPATLPDIDFVGADHRQSTTLMTDYLSRLGEPPIFLAMPRVNFNALERERAYVARMEEKGLEPIVIGVDPIEADHFEAHGFGVLDAAFSHGALCDRSILCVNDRVAIGALQAAMKHGMRPGSAASGLRIAGHDDNPLSRFTTPSLTTVAQNVDGIGHAAVARLLEKIRGAFVDGPVQIRLFDGRLVIRESA